MLNIILTVQFTVYAVYAEFSLIVLNFIKLFLKLSKFSYNLSIKFRKFLKFFQDTVTLLIYPKCITFSQKFKLNFTNYL